MIGGEIQVLLDLQQQLSEEADAFVFKLLPLLKHLLHVLHVLRGQLVQFLQGLLVAFFSLGGMRNILSHIMVLLELLHKHPKHTGPSFQLLLKIIMINTG